MNDSHGLQYKTVIVVNNYIHLHNHRISIPLSNCGAYLEMQLGKKTDFLSRRFKNRS